MGINKSEKTIKIMKQKIGSITLLVKDYDEAIAYFTTKLHFELIADSPQGKGKRWVLVTPPNSEGSCLLLAKAVSAAQRKQIGNQSGGRVFLFLYTDNFWRDYEEMKNCGINFMEEPREEAYGVVVVFEDLYGNKWDLLELKIDL